MNEPLKNLRHEKFCQLYSGKCFGYAGRAYKAAGFRCKTSDVANEMGHRMLRNVEIWSRIQFLREEIRKQMAIDAAEILKLRLNIAKDSKARKGDKLTALKDVERSLGLDEPEKHKVEHSGAVRVDLSTLSEEQLKALVEMVE